MNAHDARQNDDGTLAGVVDRNIRALLERRQQEEDRRKVQDKAADAITAFTGSMTFVVIHLVIFGLWIIINLGWIPFIPKFDASFVILAMVASVEAIFLSTFVLITQNRMAAMADKRADLDVQISLLTEHELTRAITLLRAISLKLQLHEADDPELSELARDVQPEKVLDRIEQTESSIHTQHVS
jgi:uncharacterized membrane protein